MILARGWNDKRQSNYQHLSMNIFTSPAVAVNVLAVAAVVVVVAAVVVVVVVVGTDHQTNPPPTDQPNQPTHPVDPALLSSLHHHLQNTQQHIHLTGPLLNLAAHATEPRARAETMRLGRCGLAPTHHPGSPWK